MGKGKTKESGKERIVFANVVQQKSLVGREPMGVDRGGTSKDSHGC
jgi:hypothetical protein